MNKYKVQFDGKVTLPAFVRKQLNLMPGEDYVEFILEGDRCYIRKAR